MILHALHDYYLRRCADPDPAHRLPSFGLEEKEIAFILELRADGTLQAITDTRQMVGKKKVGTSFRVPQGVKKTSGIAANLLWDNAEYVLALPDAKKLEAAAIKGGADDYRARLLDMQQAFRARIEALPAPAADDPGITAVLAFLDGQPGQQAAAFGAHADIASTNPVLSFRLTGDTELVCQRPAVVAGLTTDGGNGSGDGTGGADPAANAPGMCLITGAVGPVERLHTAIKGVWGAQTSGANIVSFNLDAFNSHGKGQGDNAPIGPAAAFAYTTALNALLARGSPQRMQVGDASTVFWAQRPDPLEGELAEIFGNDDDPDHRAQLVKGLFDAVRSGRFDGARSDNRFFVLGLAPNAARIAVRFWHAAPLSEIAHRVAAWFDDLQMVRGASDDPAAAYPSLFRLLTALAVQGKADNIPPRLGGDLMRAILAGTPYPASWLGALVQRCRAEQNVNHLRAASLRAYLRRATPSTSTNPNDREITPMLDLANPSTAYRLGRLFAALERIQEEASPGLNTTIRERYYGAASSTPVAVFTTLMRLKNHHLPKLSNKGRAVNFEKLLAEIISGIDGFPAHLNLPDQGRFAIGYYHQRQDFFTRKEVPDAATATAIATPETH